MLYSFYLYFPVLFVAHVKVQLKMFYSVPCHPIVEVMSREQRHEAGWLNHMSGDVRAFAAAVEMKLSEGMLSVLTPKYQGHLWLFFLSVPMLLLPCLIKLHADYHSLLLSGAWRGFTFGMHRARIWHSAPETSLCHWSSTSEGLCADANETWSTNVMWFLCDSTFYSYRKCCVPEY